MSLNNMFFTNKNLGKNRCCSVNLLGNIGPQGYIGTNEGIGNIGYQGSTGPQGNIGPTGLCYRGAPGPKGSQGYPGGITGAQGPTGAQGYPGNDYQIFNTTFQILASGDTYGNSYTDIVSNISSGSNVITLPANNEWSFQWSINETWIDNSNQLYVNLEELYNPGTYYNPTIFTSSTPYHIQQTTGTVPPLATGNDYLDLSLVSETQFIIKIWQKTLSLTPVNVGTINASFSFLKL